MIEAFKTHIRSYSDGLFAGFTKTAADGRRIIYPWGVFGRGYVIASADDEERLKKAYAVFLVAGVILMGAGSAFLGAVVMLTGAASILSEGFGVLGAGALILVGFGIAQRRLTATMEPAGERLSLTEAYRAQAIRHGPARQWSGIIMGVFLICIGIIGSVNVPEENRLAVAILAVIGVPFVAFFGWMLVLSRGAPPPAADSKPAKTSVLAEEAAFYFTGDVGPFRAWFITIFGLVFTGLGLHMFIFDAEERLTAAGITALFGLIAAFGISMLVVRRQRLRGR